MRTQILTLAILVLASAAAAPAQDLCPCVPVAHLWVVKTCNDWPCASTEILLAGGDPQVMALPVALTDARWLMVRRVSAGAFIDNAGDPFQLEQFDGMKNAVTRYGEYTTEHHPMLLTAPDGQVLVLALKNPEPKRRASLH
jgi:hypothetical protein